MTSRVDPPGTPSRQSTDPLPTLVMYEDRPRAIIGLKLAILSLQRHSPQLMVKVTVPGASTRVRDWLADQNNVDLVNVPLSGEGWNIKASLLLAHLDSGVRWPVWMDADVVVTGDLGALLTSCPCDALVATEDVWWSRENGTAARTLAWGLAPGRVLPTVANTAVVAVKPAHRPVLTAWGRMLNDPGYLAAQQRPWHERPLHHWGDQEVLTALLGSEAFADIPVHLLKRDVEIAQCYSAGSLGPRARLALRRSGRLPVLIHAMGAKPWLRAPRLGMPLSHRLLEEGHRQLGLYTCIARAYREQLDEDTDWLELLVCLEAWATAVKHDPLALELPLAAVDAARLHARASAGRLRTRARRLTKSMGGLGQ
jgi:hypothetical protein